MRILFVSSKIVFFSLTPKDARRTPSSRGISFVKNFVCVTAFAILSDTRTILIPSSGITPVTKNRFKALNERVTAAALGFDAVITSRNGEINSWGLTSVKSET